MALVCTDVMLFFFFTSVTFLLILLDLKVYIVLIPGSIHTWISLLNTKKSSNIFFFLKSGHFCAFIRQRQWRDDNK